MSRLTCNTTGLTLIETMMVILILGLLMAIVMPRLFIMTEQTTGLLEKLRPMTERADRNLSDPPKPINPDKRPTNQPGWAISYGPSIIFAVLSLYCATAFGGQSIPVHSALWLCSNGESGGDLPTSRPPLFLLFLLPMVILIILLTHNPTKAQDFLISLGKGGFAAVIAFVAAWTIPTAAGDFCLKLLRVELSGAQSKAILWCVVFTLVRYFMA